MTRCDGVTQWSINSERYRGLLDGQGVCLIRGGWWGISWGLPYTAVRCGFACFRKGSAGRILRWTCVRGGAAERGGISVVGGQHCPVNN